MTVQPVRSSPDLEGDDWALFLDIDGTLLDYAEHPEAVVVSDELRALLGALEKKFGGAVAFVTGRPVAMVDRLFAPLLLPAAGVFGLEHRLRPDGPVELTGAPADLDALADELEAEFAGESVFIERKGAVLGVHARTARHILARATELVERALARLPAGYRLLHGNIGFELMPLDAVKGGAIRRFMTEKPFAGRRPVFLGDDTSDEHGFEAVNELGGRSIRVRPNGPTAASHALPGVADTILWLERQLDAKWD
jgi:trehalose 6-phosphate phosphatase